MWSRRVKARGSCPDADCPETGEVGLLLRDPAWGFGAISQGTPWAGEEVLHCCREYAAPSSAQELLGQLGKGSAWAPARVLGASRGLWSPAARRQLPGWSPAASPGPATRSGILHCGVPRGVGAKAQGTVCGGGSSPVPLKAVHGPSSLRTLPGGRQVGGGGTSVGGTQWPGPPLILEP